MSLGARRANPPVRFPLRCRCCNRQGRSTSWPANGGDDESSTSHLRDYLHLHGVGKTHDHEALDDRHAGEALLALAARIGAGLVVMGAYGHSRARELVLGGATRTVLESARVPVWMTH